LIHVRPVATASIRRNPSSVITPRASVGIQGASVIKIDCDDGTLTPINKRISDFAIVGTGAELDREPVQNPIDGDD
jgi:hypothetical protein